MATVAKSDRSTKITLASASAGPFDITFRLFDEDGLDIYVNDEPVSNWTLTSNFVNGYDDDATVTFDTPLEAGDVIWVYSNLNPHRGQDYQDGPGLTKKLNIEFGRIWSSLADRKRDAGLSARFFQSVSPVALEANRALVANPDGDGLIMGPTTHEIADAEQFRNQAVEARDKSRDWAESPTPPDGPGTKSAKTWAGESEAIKDRIDLGALDQAVEDSADARDKSQEWAENPEDAPVETGKYSALHHAAKAEAAETGSEAAEAGAQTAQGLAEAARDAATVNAEVYADTAAGLAATVEGDQFQVVTGDEIIRYRHDAGPVATEVARYPTTASVQVAIGSLDQVAAPALRRSTDAQYRVHELTDLSGGLHLPGLRGLSVQDHVNRLYQRLTDRTTTQAEGTVVDAVADLGCDPRGVEPCQGIINSAMARLSETTYRGPVTIYYPRGTYKLTERILPKSGISHIGAGRDRVTFLPHGIRAAFDRRGTLTWLENCVFAHFGINGENQVLNGGSYDVQTKGAFFQGFRECVFTDLRLENTGATSLGIDFADASIIQRILVENGGRLANPGDPGGSGIGIGTGWIRNEPLVITDNITRGCTNYGVFLERQRGADVNYEARGNILSNNISIGNGYGIGECGCDGTIISHNQCLDNVGAGIALHRGTLSNGPHPGRKTLINGNILTGNAGAGVEFDGTLTFGPRGYSSDGNRIEGNGGAGHWIRGGTGGVVDDLTIRGDEIAGNGSHGIHVESGAFSNFDVIGPRLLGNTGSAIEVGAAINGGRISGATMRDLSTSVSQVGSITGAGDLTDFDISEVVGVGCAAIDLTGTLSRVTYGRNEGV